MFLPDGNVVGAEKSHVLETLELGWAKSAGSLEDTVRAARRKMVAACDHSML